MTPSKTLREREKELQGMLGSSEGQNRLQELESKYYTLSGIAKPMKTSIITYILVNERAQGLIND